MASTEYFLGKRSGFNYAVEDVAYGTANDAVTWAWPGMVQKWTDSDAQTLEPLNSMDATDLNAVSEYYPMVPKFGGTMEMLVQHMRFPMLCMGFTDSNATVTHTLTHANVIQSMGFEVVSHHTSSFGRRYDGVVCSKGDFVFTKGDWMRFNADFVAQNATKIEAQKAYQTTATPLKKYTAAQMRPFKGSDLTLKINNVDISPYLVQARLGFDNNLQVDESLDLTEGEFIAQPAPQVQTWDMGFTIKARSSALWDLFAAGAEIENCSLLLTETARTITFTPDGVMVEKVGTPIDITQGIVIQDVALKITTMGIVEVAASETDYDTVCA